MDGEPTVIPSVRCLEVRWTSTIMTFQLGSCATHIPQAGMCRSKPQITRRKLHDCLSLALRQYDQCTRFLHFGESVDVARDSELVRHALEAELNRFLACHSAHGTTRRVGMRKCGVSIQSRSLPKWRRGIRSQTPAQAAPNKGMEFAAHSNC